MNQRNPAAKKTTVKPPTPDTPVPPSGPAAVTAPTESPEAVVDVNADQPLTPARVKTNRKVLDFKQSAPEYDVNILDELVDSGRGDLAKHRDGIVDAVTDADNRSELMGVFKEDFETHRVLNMPILNEAVNNQQSTARELRGQLWKIIKSLPAT